MKQFIGLKKASRLSKRVGLINGELFWRKHITVLAVAAILDSGDLKVKDERLLKESASK